MRSTFALIFIIACLSAPVRAQYTFDRSRNTQPLPTPYTINVTREQILATAREVLGACKIPFETETQRVVPTGDKLVTEPLVFAQGVTARNDLEYYTNPPLSDLRAWTGGRVRLEIIAIPLDEKRSQMQIVAYFQGRTGGLTNSGVEEWVDVPSNGRLEDETLRGLAGKILGIDLSIDGNGRRLLLKCEY